MTMITKEEEIRHLTKKRNQAIANGKRQFTLAKFGKNVRVSYTFWEQATRDYNRAIRGLELEIQAENTKIITVKNRRGEVFSIGDRAWFPMRLFRRAVIVEFKQHFNNPGSFMSTSGTVMARYNDTSWSNIDSMTKRKKRKHG